ncbi:MAG: hypothetical protein OXC91_03865, partial [Rhodobacteraceae bacterium]|nr:hypothetical protein [Paracoccaceae bacterium]
DVSFILRSDAPTTLYLALETPTGLFGAVSATESLEKQSIELLDHASSLRETPASRWPIAVIDSNLSTEGFQYFRNSRLFADHRIIVAAASPAKAARLRYACRDDVTIVINRAESARVCAKAGEFSNAGEAAHALHDYGFARAIVTDGPNHAADVCADWSVSARPGKGQPRNWTGAGDRFLAHHIAYDAVLDDPELVLMRACDRASS